MLKKTILYEDYNGEQRKKDFYFNLTRTELLELQVSENGGLNTFLRKILMERDDARIMAYTSELILKAYGEKSGDGEYFMKTDEIRNRFKCSPAFDVLFTELTSDKDAGLKFIQGILPADMKSEIKKQLADGTLDAEIKELMPEA